MPHMLRFGTYQNAVLHAQLESTLRLLLDKIITTLFGIPALLVISTFAILIYRASSGPVFYRQMRVGENGRLFSLLKLRTMRVDANQILAEHIMRFPDAAVEWHRFFRLTDDPRIAGRAAQIARRWSIDELPQLWNVLRGDMHLVGPRPLTPAFLEPFSAQFRQMRSTVRPGVTGLWQVTGRSETDMRTMARIDRLYLRNRSLKLDLWILARTPTAVFSQRGAY